MSLEPVTFARHVRSEGRIFFSLVRKVVVLTEEVTTATTTLKKHSAEITDLKEAVRALQTAFVQNCTLRVHSDTACL